MSAGQRGPVGEVRLCFGAARINRPGGSVSLESIVIGGLQSFLSNLFVNQSLPKSFDPNIWHICGATHPVCKGLKVTHHRSLYQGLLECCRVCIRQKETVGEVTLGFGHSFSHFSRFKKSKLINKLRKKKGCAQTHKYAECLL